MLDNEKINRLKTLKTAQEEGFFVFYAKNITWVISKVKI
jgi:hypothetical protein